MRVRGGGLLGGPSCPCIFQTGGNFPARSKDINQASFGNAKFAHDSTSRRALKLPRRKYQSICFNIKKSSFGVSTWLGFSSELVAHWFQFRVLSAAVHWTSFENEDCSIIFAPVPYPSALSPLPPAPVPTRTIAKEFLECTRRKKWNMNGTEEQVSNEQLPPKTSGNKMNSSSYSCSEHVGVIY